MSLDTLSLCKQLIARPSVTPDDADCQKILADLLQPLGFEITRFDKNGVSNLWAKRGTAKPLMVFAGHTDVVPTGLVDAWQTPPFTPTEKAGMLYGRGAADMKASLAAFVVAIERFVTANPDHAGSIALLITSDEEGPAKYGTQYALEQLTAQGESLDYCLVGEPSSNASLADTIRVGRRGSLHADITIYGKQGHVAYPDLAKNPIHLLSEALAELCHSNWDEGDDNFPKTSFQCSNIAAGTGASNVIPDTLTLKSNFRFSPASTVESLKTRVETILTRHQLNYKVDWHVSALPFYSQPGKLRQATHTAIKELMGAAPINSTSGGTSDARFIAPLGTEVLELGPINATIHQIDECVAIADLERLSQLYTRILENLFI